MSRKTVAQKGFLARLARSETGNVLAMTAAGIFPLMGMVGGAVDMARIYAVRARLQAACDAGALAGRRVMGTGQWSDNSGRANTIAQNAFDLNFKTGFFGSINRTRTFSENDGTVTGTASADIPMTLMRLFGTPTKTISVTCDGMMRIPNTDVMFVLDNSGSMAWTIPGDSSGQTKITGLRIAIKCFYEALAKQDIDDVTPTQCGTTSNPSGGLSSSIQLRFGFVNYDNMVNVGQLLPNDYLVDSWTYQSREPHYQTVYAWSLGSPTNEVWDRWNTTTPSSFGSASGYNSFSIVSGGNSASFTMSNGSSVTKLASGYNSTTCPNLNTFGDLVGVQESAPGSAGSTTYTASDNDPPVHPATVQNQTMERTRKVSVTYGYRYRYFKNSGTNGCWLERASKKTSGGADDYWQSQYGTAEKSITWTEYTTIDYWTYKPVTFNVSGLKAGGSNWNSSVSLPIGESNGPTVKLSGSNSNTTIKYLSNTSVTWNGCIEERDTFANTDGTPSDDWNNFPTTPDKDTAHDMDIDTPPVTGDSHTQWRPILHNAVWGRRDTLSSGGSWSGSYTTAAVNGGLASSTNVANNSCVGASRRLQTYTGTSGASSLKNYVNNTVAPNNNTYHDIGLLWGARLMSPTGIFASDNATTPGGAQIQRHMIFMTDGDTANTWNNYASYGLEWWDRRQINPTGLTNTQFETKLQDNNNARAAALCTAIKNKGITLWVISYGDALATSTVNRLRSCATSSDYFFQAANTTDLITQFRNIADKISQLRLTS